MPLMPDSRIPGSALSSGNDQQAGGGFLGTLGSMMKIKEQALLVQQQQREAEKAKRDEEDDLETRSALQRYETPDEAVTHLWKGGRSQAASKLATAVYTQRKAASDEYDATLKSHGASIEQAAQIADSISDQKSLDTARPAMISLAKPIYGDKVEDLIPTLYDEAGAARLKQLVTAGTQRVAQIQMHHNAILQFQNAWELGLEEGPGAHGEGDEAVGGLESPNRQKMMQAYREGLANLVVTADNEDQFDQYRILARKHGAPEKIIAEFGKWQGDGSETRARARSLAMTAPQEATAGVAATNAKSEAQRAETAAQREQRLARGTGGGGLTRSQSWQVEDKEDAENKDTEKWGRDEWDKLRKPPRDQWQKDKNGRPVEPTFSLDTLPDAIKNEFVDRKLETKNKARVRQGLPSLEAAAKAASAQGDVASYTELYNIYKNITVGTRDLTSIAKPPSGFQVPRTAAEKADALKRGLEIEQLLKTTTDPAIRAKLIEEQRALAQM